MAAVAVAMTSAGSSSTGCAAGTPEQGTPEQLYNTLVRLGLLRR